MHPTPATPSAAALLKDLKALLEKVPSPPKAKTPYDELEELATACLPTASRWRKFLQQHADPVARTMMSEMSACPVDPPPVTKEGLCQAFRQGVSQKLESSQLNQFAGVNQGTSTFFDATGSPLFPPITGQWKQWSPVKEEKNGLRSQMATNHNSLVSPSSAGPGIEVQLNIHTRENGLLSIARTFNAGQQNDLFLVCYPLPSGPIVWVGQSVTPDGKPVPEDKLFFLVNWRGLKQGNPASYCFGYQAKVNISTGDVHPDRTYAIHEFPSVSPRIAETRNTLHTFKPLFGTWRKSFGGATATALASNIAKSFDETRGWGQFATAVLSAAEIERALTDPGQVDSFTLGDLDQFAGKWNSVRWFYARDSRLIKPPIPMPTFQNWLHLSHGAGGIYQYVTGSHMRHVDPFSVITGDEEEVLEVVVDAYLPDYGICGWLSKCKGFPTPAGPVLFECPLMAYRLAGERYLWLSQRYTVEQLKKAEKQPENPVSDEYDIAFEWAIRENDKIIRYLVNDTFKIDFNTGVLTRTKDDLLIKSRSTL